jgi:hypothetical protein
MPVQIPARRGADQLARPHATMPRVTVPGPRRRAIPRDGWIFLLAYLPLLLTLLLVAFWLTPWGNPCPEWEPCDESHESRVESRDSDARRQSPDPDPDAS